MPGWRDARAAGTHKGEEFEVRGAGRAEGVVADEFVPEYEKSDVLDALTVALEEWPHTRMS